MSERNRQLRASRPARGFYTRHNVTHPVTSPAKMQKFREAPMQVFSMIRQERGQVHLNAIVPDRIHTHVYSLGQEETEMHLIEVHGISPQKVEEYDDKIFRHRLDHEEHRMETHL